MKIRPLMSFKQEEIVLTIQTMQEYRNTLNKNDRALFDLDLSKIIRYGREVELDGCGMKQIAISLKRIALKKYEEVGRHTVITYLLMTIAQEVQLARIIFQRDNGPTVKIDKKILTA